MILKVPKLTSLYFRVGFIEIYNEKICDLYDPENVDLKIMEINNDMSVNCKEVICQSVDDMLNVIKVGNRNKKIGDTDMNDRSSRSHTIFHIVRSSNFNHGTIGSNHLSPSRSLNRSIRFRKRQRSVA